MTNAEHLLPFTRTMLDLPDAERIIEMKRDRWMGYPRAKEVLERMEGLFTHPRISRMPNMLLIGRTNNGKTQILKRFRELHAATDGIGDEAVTVPVVYVQAPSVPDEKRLYADILNVLFAKFTISDHAHKLLSNVKDKFAKVGVRVLIIDEMNSLVSGSLAKQRQFLTVLKHLSNELQISIVGAGTEDAVRAMQTDPQLTNRFIPMSLPRWQFDTSYRQLLASCEKLLPLRNPSNLSASALAHNVWARSDGTIGETMALLREAAEYSIKSGREKIDQDALEKCDYRSPSDRKKKELEGV